MKFIRHLFLLLVLGCQSKEPKSIFESLRGKEDVEIYLTNYKLDSVPPEIRILAGVKRLYISKDSAEGLTIYPPLSALGQSGISSSTRHLPKEITELTSLKSLSLVNLDLITLPDDIEKLQNLDSLFLYMNKLTISNEVEKLKKLKRLKYLGILGNTISANDLIQLKASNPKLIIIPDLR